jgi:N-glycosylase/DNA lyase
MNYTKQKNKITIKDAKNFNIKHILECGQVFRYKNEGDYYQVISGDEIARIYNKPDSAEIICSNENYFENYFDLKTNYTHIKEELSNFSILKNAIDYGYGIRILRQKKIEVIISFIISANNNIKRIQATIDKLCIKFGQKVYNKQFGEYYAFTTLTELNKLTEQDFIEINAGYRAKQLVKTVQLLNNINLESIDKLETNQAITELTKLYGVGPKVADCILLFGFYRMDVFPVDTWIQKIYNNYFNKKNNFTANAVLARKELTHIFTKLSGYAQQYLFYYERDTTILKNKK